MKKLVEGIYRILGIIIVFVGYVLSPINVYAINENQTLGDLKQTLKELQAKEQANKNKKRQTQAEINNNIKKKQTAENNLMKTKEEVENINEEIEHTGQEIEKLKEKNKELLVLYQKAESENFYYSYITGSSSITDMIMRMDAMNILTEYNEEQLNNLETLIKNNEKLEKQLKKYEKKLDKQIVEYQNATEVLRDELAELEEGEITIQDEINNMQKVIKYYQDMGCKDNQKLSVCIDAKNNNGWRKPVTKGRITSLYGKRAAFANSYGTFHRGIDIGVGEGTPVYPTANGVVGAIVRRSSCGGNMLYIWATVNNKPYTYVYMHLKSINVEIGKKVTVNDIVAYSGGGVSTASKYGGYDRCTTGAHLHYGVAEGGFYGSSKSTPLSAFNSHTINPPGYPGLYQWFYSR